MSLNLTLGALRARNGLSPYGEGLGALLGTGSGSSARLSGLSPDKTADVFGADIVRRTSVLPIATEATGANSDATTDAASTAPVAPPTPTDAEREALSGALSGSVRWMADTFGDAAATAVMGIVYKRIGDGPVTEDALGDGLLDALRFVDRQFGTASGDAFMAQLNGGGLNDALNDYFDNGLNERFLVAGAGNLADDAVQGVEAAKATLVQQVADGDGGGTDPMQSLLDMLRQMGTDLTKRDPTDPADPVGAQTTGTAAAATGGSAPADTMSGLLSGALSSLSGQLGLPGQSGGRTGGLAAAYGPTGAAVEDLAALAPGLLLHASV
ncbi:hypothetical protein [Nitratidesulfovibrio sp. 1201_IL3209]|uniref:hypothetical protein n=1 Tax=Nitratidesulfovibrio sp. 1201_IL3209 TaxID=3084053 RepID=UPI002FDAF533